MQEFPKQVTDVGATLQLPDDVLIVAASWEERCVGLLRRLGSYSSTIGVLVVYDGHSERRLRFIREADTLLAGRCEIRHLDTLHSDPIPSVRELVSLIRTRITSPEPQIAVDITTFTRKHLLQLLQGLDLAGLLPNTRFYYTSPQDYETQDDEPIAQGISGVGVIRTFAGRNRPSHDSLLVLFLGYEGRRALSLWEHLDPNVTLAVIPDPPYRLEWAGRTEALNKYLLSSLPKEHQLRCPALLPKGTYELMECLWRSERFGTERFDYLVAPFGPKPQLLGMYRFWRHHRGEFSVVYAAPLRYREEKAVYPPGPSWLVDTAGYW
jgi:hypothetical protein